MGNIGSVDLSVQPNWHNKQCIASLSIVRLPLDITIPYPDKYVSLTRAMRQLVLCCELKGKLVWQLSLGMNVGIGFESQSNLRACRQMMRIIAMRMISKSLPLVRAKEAEELYALGQCAAAQGPLQKAIYFGDLPSRALKACMLIDGREGVPKDCNGAFELVEEGARLGCHHCQGVLAWCYRLGFRCEGDAARSLELMRASAGKGSRYGQYVLGRLYLYGAGGVAQDDAQAFALYQLAAAQNFDEAQYRLGYRYNAGLGVAQDDTEALRLYQLAAAQGHPAALFMVAAFHEEGRCVPVNEAEAIRWYRRAQAAGYLGAAADLRRLRA